MTESEKDVVREHAMQCQDELGMDILFVAWEDHDDEGFAIHNMPPAELIPLIKRYVDDLEKIWMQ